MSKKQKDELIVTKKFSYRLRECSLNFELSTLVQMKDFKKLLEKSLEDLQKTIEEYEIKK